MAGVQQTPLNALSVDVEEYFHVSNFQGVIPRSAWETLPSRVERSMEEVLQEMENHGQRATFFILGWLARRHPALIRRLHLLGHEVAAHSMEHDLVYNLTPRRFREDAGQCKRELEQITGGEVIGYRAPSYSITRRSWWALGVLAELGYRYDSSIFPVRHYRYGIPGYVRFPHHIPLGEGGGIWEFPISTLSLGGATLPIGGGAYLRFLPVRVVHWGLRRINRRERQPAVLYFHPWEIDPGQPRIKAGLRLRVNQYHNLGRMSGKLRHLYRSFRFAPLREVLGL